MRIALCLSGQPRGLPLSCEKLKEGLYGTNDNIDVFFHAWHNPEDAGKSFESSQPAQAGKVGVVHPNAKEILLSEYTPIDYILQEQREFSWARDLIQAPSAVQEHIASMFYSMTMANYLKRVYEILWGFEYDVVIRTRFDLVYYQPITFSDYIEDIKAGYVLTSQKFQDEREVPGSFGGNTMSDIFVFGNSPVMDKFSSTYQNFAYINTKITPPFGENYLGYQVKVIHKIPVKTIPIEYEIMHRVVDINNV